jgi:tripartite-type tricarboxylate transporter receptor subunit TctC
MIRQLRVIRLATLGLALAASTYGSASADVSFQGKTLNLYVAGGIGKGIDNYGRTLIRYLNKYLPGEPTIVVTNMPGAGGVQGVQYLYNIAPKDGTAFGTTGSGPISEQLMPKGKVNYDVLKFGWIGSLVKGDVVCGVWHTSAIKTLDEAKSHEITLSITAASEASPILLMNALLGTRFKPIIGYNGMVSLLAVERGEVDGTCPTIGTLRMARPDWLSENKLRLLTRVSLDADPDYLDVRRVVDLLKTDEEQKMYELLVFPHEFGAPFMMPPGTSGGMLAVYRRAFDAAVRDPAYRAEAKKQGQDIQPRDGADVNGLLQKAFATPHAIIQRTIEAIKPR